VRLNVAYDTNAYGSIGWAIMGLHTTRLLSDVVDTGVLTALTFTRHAHANLLGVLLILSPTVWYASYADAEWPDGLSALEHQQLAGLITRVPLGVVYVAAALALLAAGLREDGASKRRRGLLAAAG